MQSSYSVEGSSYFPHDKNSLVIAQTLPADVYVVKAHPMRGYYLERTDHFELPSKLYGTVSKDALRILNTFQLRPASTGVMLSGDAGSGKTMLAKKLSVDAMAQGIPTIVVNSEFSGQPFNSLIQGIQQDAIVLFDEFEKIYGSEEQEEILTLLDGTVKTKKLFVFTCNDKWKVNEHMKNRPGRIFYLKQYDGLDENFIREYTKDNLKPELFDANIEVICTFADTFQSFNFDILKAIVEEMNRYDEPAKVALELLNARPGFMKTHVRYAVTVTHLESGVCYDPGPWSGSPLTDDDLYMRFSFYRHSRTNHMINSWVYSNMTGSEKAQGEGSYLHIELQFDEDHVVGIQPDKTILVENKDLGYSAKLTKIGKSNFTSLNYLV